MTEPKDSKTQSTKPFATIVEALRGRNATYDMLANVYFMPLTAEQVNGFAAADLSAYENINDELTAGINDMKRYLAKRDSGTRQELAVDYTGAFGCTSSWKGRYAAPYESVHTSEEGLMFQGAYHEVYQLYRQYSVERAEGYDYPHDHLSFMCEFLVVLSNRAIEALERENADAAVEWLSISRDFLNAHILSWFDTLSELAGRLLHTRFYRGVLKFTKGFFLFDEQLLADIIGELQTRSKES